MPPSPLRAALDGARHTRPAQSPPPPVGAPHRRPFNIKKRRAQGDWHDTLLQGGDETKVRLFTDSFAGKVVVHCHILEHEDQGMMGLLSIGGTEGALYTKVPCLARRQAAARRERCAWQAKKARRAAGPARGALGSRMGETEETKNPAPRKPKSLLRGLT